MLVGNANEAMLSAFRRACVGVLPAPRQTSEGHWLADARISLRNVELFGFSPNKLSAALAGAFKAMAGRFGSALEVSYSQWQQFAVCADEAATRRSRVPAVKPWMARLACANRRVKAFVVAQKVNGRNAP